MKKFLLFGLIAFSTLLNVYAQKSESVLFTIGDQAIMASEFQYIYEKNNKNDANYYTEASVREYLDLFIKFKLKVAEARSLGIDTTEAFKKEFNSYRSQLTKPYMTDNSTTKKLVKEAYDRMHWELRASHILIMLKKDADEATVAAAEKKIKDIYKQAAKGADFAELAVKYSEDPSVKNNKGDLGYFSAFHLIYDFENVAFNTELGHISKPFRTEFGYHILKITDKKPYQGSIKVAQIYIRQPMNADSAKIMELKQKADMIFDKINKGENFEKMVEMYSDDKRSAGNGGIIPEFTNFSYNIPQSFKDAAFNLKNDGDISAPVHTPIGWHIIKRISIKPLESFDELEKTITNKVKKDSRSNLSKQNMILGLKKQNHFKIKKKAYSKVLDQVDTNLLTASWNIPNPDALDLVLFQIGKEKVPAIAFANYLVENQKRNKFNNVKYAVETMYKNFEEQYILDFADRHLEENYPEFRNLVNEYHEGMMLFEITDQRVWTKAMNDTLGQRNFYNEHKDNYMWQTRADAEILICKDKDVAIQAQTMLNEGMSAKAVAEELNLVEPLNISYSKSLYEKSENQDVDKFFGKKGAFLIEPANENINWKIVHIGKYLEPEPKNFNKIRGIVIADYQAALEKSWIEELKQKYPVHIYEDVLSTLYHK